MKLGVLFGLSGVLIALSSTLPWHVGIACAMFSAFATFYASDGLRTRLDGRHVSAEWAYKQRDRDLGELQDEYMGHLLDQVASLDTDLEDKAWCLYMTRLFLVCAFFCAGLGAVVRAITELN